MSKKSQRKMSNQPVLVSVIVAGYNVAKYLPKCLEALLKQTLKDIEIIVIDDGSDDDTKNIITRYAKQDSRIVPIYVAEHQGVSAARNLGMAKARAEYLMVCDADDFYHPEMCEKMHAAMERTGADAAACEDNIIYRAHPEMRPSDEFYYSLKFSGLNDMNDSLVLGTDLSVHNKIFRKSLIKKYDLTYPEGLLYEDAYFCAAYFCISKEIYYLNERLYNYVRHAHSTMSNTWSNDKTKDTAIDHLYVAFRLYEFLEKHHLLTQYNELFWQLFYNFEYFALTNSKTAERKQQVRQEAKNFIDEHAESFAGAEIGCRNDIISLNARKFLPNTARLKRLVLRLMPTYRLQISNVLRMRSLKTKQQNLIKQLNRLMRK